MAWRSGPPPTDAVFPRYYYYRTKGNNKSPGSLIAPDNREQVIFTNSTYEWVGPLPNPDDFPLCEVKFPISLQQRMQERAGVHKDRGVSASYLNGYRQAIDDLVEMLREPGPTAL
jgi:hypothetical protein